VDEGLPETPETTTGTGAR